MIFASTPEPGEFPMNNMHRFEDELTNSCVSRLDLDASIELSGFCPDLGDRFFPEGFGSTGFLANPRVPLSMSRDVSRDLVNSLASGGRTGS